MAAAAGRVASVVAAAVVVAGVLVVVDLAAVTALVVAVAAVVTAIAVADRVADAAPGNTSRLNEKKEYPRGYTGGNLFKCEFLASPDQQAINSPLLLVIWMAPCAWISASRSRVKAARRSGVRLRVKWLNIERI